MMDLFPEGEEEDEILEEEEKKEEGMEVDEDSLGPDACRDAKDITTMEAMEELAELNPNQLLPYILPLNAKYTETREPVSEVFNRTGLQLMHIQLPNTLPAIDLKLEGEEIDESEAESSKKFYQSSRIDCLPSGKIGKLKFYKSGKIKLHIDGHVFDFFEGTPSTCKQQVCCHLEKNKEFIFLGNFSNRFVISPDLSDVGSYEHT